MRSSAVLLVPGAIDRFDARVRAIPGNLWNNPTPCAEWVVRAWERAAQRSRPSWAGADPSATVHLSYADASPATYAEQMLLDLTVHGWDLARGCGQNATLDPEAVDRGLAYARENVAGFAGYGIFDPPIPCTSAGPAVQLLALLGRNAS